MPTSVEAFESILQNRRSVSDKKKRILTEAEQRKKDYLDPEWRRLDMSNVQGLDADTLRSIQPETEGLDFRLTPQAPGYHYDAYETDPRRYEENPDRFNAHARSYGQRFGMDPANVTPDHLVAAGLRDKEIRMQQLQGLSKAGALEYKLGEMDQYGRQTMQLRAFDGSDPSGYSDPLKERTGRDVNALDQGSGNAGYNSSFNAARRLQDFASGAEAEHQKGAGSRSWKRAGTDSLVNMGAAAVNMGLDLAQSTALMGALGKPTAGMFQAGREGVEKLKQALISPQQKRRERLTGDRDVMSEGLYNLRRDQYKAAGSSDEMANLKAFRDESGDTLQYLWDNPGRSLDGFMESVPYMLGVAGIGRKALTMFTKKAVSKFEKELLDETDNLARAGIDASTDAGKKAVAEIAEERAAKYFKSDAGKDAIKAYSDKVGSTVVGLTEGLSNGATTYAQIVGMTEEEAQQSKEYRALRESGKSHRDALHQLGIKAFATVAVMDTALAGAASKLTGAGGIEARLFKGSITKKAAADLAGEAGETIGKDAAEESAGMLRQALGATGRGVAAVGRTFGPPGLKEALEEGIQSGGGTLLSQIAAKSATGRPVGPGVGAATTEGAVIGGLSGAVLGGGADAIRNMADSGAAEKLAATARPLGTAAKKVGNVLTGRSDKTGMDADSIPTVGGQRTTAYNRVRQKVEAGNYDPTAEFNTLADKAEGSVEKGYSYDMETFQELEVHFRNMENQILAKEAEIKSSGRSAEQKQTELEALKATSAVAEKRFQDIYTRLKGEIGREADQVRTKLAGEAGKDYKLTEKDRLFLGEAISAQLYTQEEVDELVANLKASPDPGNQATAEVLHQKGVLAKHMEAAKAAGQLALDLQEQTAVDGDTGDSAELSPSRLRGQVVANNKMGNTVSQIRGTGRTVLGAQAHVANIDEEIRKAVDSGDFSNVKEAIAKFSNFVNNQKNKIAAVKAKLAEFKGKESGTFTLGKGPDARQYNYVPGVTEKWYQALVQEQKEMEAMLKGVKVLEEKYVVEGSTATADEQAARVARAKAAQARTGTAEEGTGTGTSTGTGTGTSKKKRWKKKTGAGTSRENTYDSYDWLPLNEGEVIKGQIRLASGELIPIVEGDNVAKQRKDGNPVHAWVSHGRYKDKNGENRRVMYVNRAKIKESFPDKPWTKPQVEGVDPLADDAFTTAEDWFNFVVEHEIQHLLHPNTTGMEKAAYENETNQRALKVDPEERAASVLDFKGKGTGTGAGTGTGTAGKKKTTKKTSKKKTSKKAAPKLVPIEGTGGQTMVDHQGRKIVVVDIDGTKVPFYNSTGQNKKDGVTPGKWYPALGIGPDGWINKKSGVGNYYGSAKLREAAEMLDATLGDVRKQDAFNALDIESPNKDRPELGLIYKLSDLLPFPAQELPVKGNEVVNDGNLDKNIAAITKALDGSTPTTATTLTPLTAAEQAELEEGIKYWEYNANDFTQALNDPKGFIKAAAEDKNNFTEGEAEAFVEFAKLKARADAIAKAATESTTPAAGRTTKKKATRKKRSKRTTRAKTTVTVTNTPEGPKETRETTQETTEELTTKVGDDLWQKGATGEEGQQQFVRSQEAEDALRVVRDAVRAALVKMGFKFTDKPDVDLSELEQIASKILTGLHNDDARFLQQAAKALSYALYYELKIPERTEVQREWVERALYEWLTTGKEPTKLTPVQKSLWMQLVTAFERLMSFFSGKEYRAIEDRLVEAMHKIKTGADFSYKPKPGYEPLVFQEELDANPAATEVLLALLNELKVPYMLTGSVAYSNQVAVYRKKGKPLHDVDILVAKEDIPRILQFFAESGRWGKPQKLYDFNVSPPADEDTGSGQKYQIMGLVLVDDKHEVRNFKYGFNKKSKGEGMGITWIPWRKYEVYKKGTNEKVGSYSYKQDDHETFNGYAGITVDLMENRNPKRKGYTEPYVDENGTSHDIPISSYVGGFKAKLAMVRYKDVGDYLAVVPPDRPGERAFRKGVPITRTGALAQQGVPADEDATTAEGMDFTGEDFETETSDEVTELMQELDSIQQELDLLKAKAQIYKSLTPEDDARLAELMQEGEEAIAAGADMGVSEQILAERRAKLYRTPNFEETGNPEDAGIGLAVGVEQKALDLPVKNILTGRSDFSFEAEDTWETNDQGPIKEFQIGQASPSALAMEAEETRTAEFNQSNQRIRALIKRVREDESLNPAQKADLLKQLEDQASNLSTSYYTKGYLSLFYRTIREINKAFYRFIRPINFDRLIKLPKQVRDLAHTVGSWHPKDDEIGFKGMAAREALLRKWTNNPDELSPVDLATQVIQDSMTFFKTYGFPSSIGVFSAGAIRLSDLKANGTLKAMNLKKPLNDNVIPDSLEDVFKDNRPEIRGLIAGVPNLITLLTVPAFRKTVVESLGLTAEEVVMLDGVMAFVKEFRAAMKTRSVAGWYDANNKLITNKRRTLPFENGKYADEYARKDPTNYFRDEKGELNENLIFAMAMAAHQYLVTRASRTIENDDAAINSILNRSKHHTVTQKERDALGTVGVNRNLVKDEIGALTYAMLNLRSASYTFSSMEDRLISTIGNTAIATLHAMGIFEGFPVSAKLINTMRAEGSDGKVTMIKERDINFIRIRTEQVYNESTGHTYERPIAKVTALRAHKVADSTLLERIMGLKAMHREPMLTQPTEDDVPSRVRNSSTHTSKELRRGMHILNSRAWVESPLMRTLMRMSGVAYMEMAHKVLTDDQLEATHVYTRNNKESRNQQLLREWDHTFEWHHKNKGKKFWLKHYAASNIRVMVDSDTINYQNSKFQRAIYQMEDWAYQVSTKGENALTQPERDTLTGFKLALAQGFGIKIEKSGRTVGESLKMLDELLNTKEYQAALAFINTQMDLEAQADRDGAELGYIPDAELEVLRPLVAGFDGRKGNGTAAMAAMHEYARFLRTAPGENFEAHLTVSVDGITNGYAATNLQFPLDIRYAGQEYIDSLRACGLNTKDHDQPFVGKDIYQDLAARTFMQQQELVYRTNEAYNEELKKLDQSIDHFEQEGEKGIVYSLRRRKQELLFQREHVLDVLQLGLMAKMGRDTSGSSALSVNSVEVSDDARDDAKLLFVPANYGAGRTASRRSVVEANIERFYQKLAQTGVDANGKFTGRPTDATYALMEQVRGLINGVRKARVDAGIYNSYKELPESWSSNFGNTLVTEKLLTAKEMKDFREALNAINGHAVSAALESKLAAQERMRERMHEITYLANIIYTAEFNRRVAEYTKNYGAPGKRARHRIVQQIQGENLFPGLDTTFSSENVDRLDTTESIVDFKTGPEHENQIGFEAPIQMDDFYMDENGDVHEVNKSRMSISSGVAVRNPSDDVGVAAMVTMTHSYDSATNFDVFTKYSVGHLFDSFMVTPDEAVPATNTANTSMHGHHRDHAMVDAYYGMLQRMLRLLSDSDTRFTKEEKGAIWEKFATNGLTVMSEETRAQTLDLWLKEMGEEINRTKENRSILFGPEGLTSLRNFPHPMGGAAVIDPNSVDARAPSERVSIADNLETLVGRFVDTVMEADVAKKDNLKSMLILNIDNEKVFRETLERYVGAVQPTAHSLLTILDEVYGVTQRTSAQDMVRQTLRVISEEDLMETVVRPWDGRALREEGVFGVYIPENQEIQINFKGDPTGKYLSVNPAVTLSHEAMHAGTYKVLMHEYDSNLEGFKAKIIGPINKALLHDRKLVEQGVEIPYRRSQSNVLVSTYLAEARDAAAHTDKSLTLKESKALSRRMYLRAASEFLAHRATDIDTRSQSFQDMLPELASDPSAKAVMGVLEQLRLTSAAMRKQAEATAKEKAAKEAMFRTQKPLGPGPFPGMGSSQTGVNEDMFTGTRPQLLTSAMIRELFTRYDLHGFVPDTAEGNQLLDNLIEDVLLPGYESIEDLFQRARVNPAGTTNEGLYVEETNTIYIEAAGNQATVPVHEGAMSLKEVYAHELIHAILKTAIDGNIFLQRQVQRLFDMAKAQLTWKDFMPENVVGNVQEAEAIAKQRYDYIFNNIEGNALHEFAAIGLTNAVFANKLKNLNEKDVAKPIWEGANIKTLINVLSAAINWIADKLMNTRGTNLHASLTKIAHATIAINNQNRAREAKIRNGDLDFDGRYGRMAHTANSFVAKLIAEKVVAPMSKYASGQEKKFTAEVNAAKAAGKPRPKLGLRGTLNMAMAAAFAENNEGFEKALSAMLVATKQTKDSAFPSIMGEFFGVDPRNFEWSNVMRKTKRMVDGVRRDAIESTTRVLLEAFDPKLLNRMTSAHKESITNAILKTDLSALMDRFSFGQLFQLLQEPEQVSGHVFAIREELKALLKNDTNGELYRDLTIQAEGLGIFMATGKVSIRNLMPNAYAIANQFAQDDTNRRPLDRKVVPRVEQLVDELATLHALTHTAPHDLQRAAPIVEHEMNRQTHTNGFVALLGQHKAFKQESLVRSFNNVKTNMWKGYVYENFDPSYTTEMVEDTPQNNAKMIHRGFRKVSALRKDPVESRTMPWRKEMNLWVSYHGLSTYQQAAISLRDIHHRGFDIMDAIDAGEYTTTAASRAALSGQVLNKMRRANFQAAYKQREPGYRISDPDRESIMLPIMDDGGRIVGYRYVMAEQTKKDVLKKKDMFDVVMGRMYGAIEDKESTATQNSFSAKLMHREWVAFGNDDRHRFIEFTPDSKDPRVVEIYRLIPKQMREELKQLFKGDIFYLRDEAVHMALGYRKLAMADIPQLGGMRPLVYILEKGWREFLSYTKVKIAIQAPAVALGNLASNVNLLNQDAIPPQYTYRKGVEAGVAMGMYQKNLRKRDDLQKTIARDLALGRKIPLSTQSRLAEAHASLERNPVHFLVESGLVSSIVDEFDVDEHSYRGQLLTKLTDKAVGTFPRGIVRGVQELYMLPGSMTYNLAMKFTQYSDYAARYVKYEYDTDVRHKDINEAMHDALQMFIYYDRPQHPWLQVANDNGGAMFTKFFLRAQPQIGILFRDKPVTALAYYGMQQAMMPHPYSDNILNYVALGQFENMDQRFPLIPVNAISGVDYIVPGMWSWLMLPLNMGIPVQEGR